MAGKKINLETFLERSRKAYGLKYNYSQVVYINCDAKVKITCPIHGTFEQTPQRHKSSGCPECFYNKQGQQHSAKSNGFENGDTASFIIKLKEIYGDLFSYEKTVYSKMNEKAVITCPKHGDIEREARQHLKGYECQGCYNDRRKITNEEFIKRSKEQHGDYFDYSKSNYTLGKALIEIICPKHGSFWQMAEAHISGSGCKNCKRSRGELLIKKFLTQNCLNFETEKRFKTCINPKTKYMLPFDFFLLDYNLLIEFDGAQHFNKPPPEWTTQDKTPSQMLNDQRWRDKVKTDWAKNNGIILFRLNYRQLKNIGKELVKFFKEKFNCNFIDDIEKAWQCNS